MVIQSRVNAAEVRRPWALWRTRLVVVDPPGYEEDSGLEQAGKELPVEILVAQSAVWLSIQASCQGAPGSMNTVPVSLNPHPSATT